MIQNQALVNKFYKGLLKKNKLSHRQAIRIYEALHQQAISLGAINSKTILNGIEIDIKIARAINALRS